MFITSCASNAASVELAVRCSFRQTRTAAWAEARRLGPPFSCSCLDVDLVDECHLGQSSCDVSCGVAALGLAFAAGSSRIHGLQGLRSHQEYLHTVVGMSPVR
eukprot:5064339-Amphidinium_carterae.1